MLVRRRKVRIEIEQQTVRMEAITNAPVIPVTGTTDRSAVEPVEQHSLHAAPGGVTKTLKTGEEL